MTPDSRIGCPRCGAECRVQAHDHSHCSQCFTSFRLSEVKPDNPHCSLCGQLHGFGMADLMESDPALPVYCRECEARICEAHGHLDCEACSSTAEPQGERVRLFEPAPSPMAGQLAIGELG